MSAGLSPPFAREATASGSVEKGSRDARCFWSDSG